VTTTPGSPSSSPFTQFRKAAARGVRTDAMYPEAMEWSALFRHLLSPSTRWFATLLPPSGGRAGSRVTASGWGGTRTPCRKTLEIAGFLRNALQKAKQSATKTARSTPILPPSPRFGRPCPRRLANASFPSCARNHRSESAPRATIPATTPPRGPGTARGIGRRKSALPRAVVRDNLLRL
jgi:hypothetical protein